MEILVVIAGVLLALFSVALAWYLGNYKLQIRHPLNRTLVFLGLSGAIFVTASAAFIMAIWPPLWPL